VAGGDVLDVDIGPGGRLVWDAWRVRDYARSRGEEIEVPAALEARRELAASGVIIETTRPGWFAISDR
jgi:hypothetical protein